MDVEYLDPAFYDEDASKVYILESIISPFYLMGYD